MRLDCPDHKVLCLVDQSCTSLVGLAEVSMQPADGNTAPPFPMPRLLKQLNFQPQYPYLSNLVIDRAYRRKGYAKKLVRACEIQAVEWGHSKIFLHVDLDYPAATGLYANLGYSTIRDDPPIMKMFDGVRLRYMSKQLRGS